MRRASAFDEGAIEAFGLGASGSPILSGTFEVHERFAEELAAFKQFSMCINCMLCYSACPVVANEPEFIGPAAIALGHRYNIATDYHINESPMMEQEHFKHKEGNSTYITPDDYEKIDELIDWLMQKHDEGYKMANPKEQLANMKNMMRGLKGRMPQGFPF